MNDQDVLGVLGGMGPLASAKFVSDIYNGAAVQMPEQWRPQVIALHQPLIADRTQAILEQKDHLLVDALSRNLELLRQMACSRVLVTCFTVHTVIPKLPVSQQQMLWDLRQVLRDHVDVSKRYLVLCTDGSRHSGIFCEVAIGIGAQFVYPSKGHQVEIHALIYRLKAGELPEAVWPALASLLGQYQVDGVISGCTEFYLLAQQMSRYSASRHWHYLDALAEVIRVLTRCYPHKKLANLQH